MRKRWEQFTEAVLRRYGETGELNEAVVAGAVQDSFTMFSNHKSALKRGELLLRQPQIQESLRAIFKMRGFDLLDTVDWHIKHITGEANPEAGPNYAALRDLEKMTLPQPPTRIDQRVLVGHSVRTGEGSLPKTRARILSAHIERNDDA